ncbi:hypothetical protein DUNSADRAFT_8293 [Dunaliella salina]|uniref:Encoded protein n=1 Tax=Dunaliella salina TaxID=3046 RepID=A0ABQ7HA99_DUNSA|nr:hypothetical protein DUNSADRAFT_8293 [Dunaliella salina]|eukprot:KAF5843778.1 hypothetical protein DUNSADRAFT_8293 [Dunaliella salina]
MSHQSCPCGLATSRGSSMLTDACTNSIRRTNLPATAPSNSAGCAHGSKSVQTALSCIRSPLFGANSWQLAAPLHPGSLSVHPLPTESLSHPGHSRRYERARPTRPSAGAMDVMPAWTLDQIAGLLFGALMLAAVLGAKQLDVIVARQQRRQLGLCEECGGIFEPSSCTEQQCPMKGRPPPSTGTQQEVVQRQGSRSSSSSSGKSS